MSASVTREFDDLVARYPASLAAIAERNRTRMIWQINEVVNAVPAGGKVIDLGGGAVPFMAVCQRLGFETTVIDDFGDATYGEVGEVLELFDEIGVNVNNTSLFDDNLDLGSPNSVGLICSHDSMEHWHQSPKQLFAHAWESLQASGIFWLGVPNAVNLRKRMTVPFGKGSWSHMDDWYEQEMFRGHVREPVVADLDYIAADIGARDYTVYGKNWLGYRHPNAKIRKVAPYIDRPLQMRPSLCSDIYLWATKS